MPRLVKGGKNVFGWSRVSESGRIVIPPDAFAQYQLLDSENAILLSGSKASGGFGLTTAGKLKESSISGILTAHPELAAYQVPEGEVIRFSGRVFCWASICNKGITVPPATLRMYGIERGDLLLSVRGSNLALGFIVRGSIVEEARRHPGLRVFV